MIKAELVKRSPLRILDKSTHGGLDTGKLGVVASQRGVGKTACLVHLATDQLLQGKHVIHVSFAEKTDHIMTWYETIFKELTKSKSLDAAVDVHEDLIKNRVIMGFNQATVSIDHVLKSITSLISDGHFNAELIVMDGYDFIKGSPQFVEALKQFAQKNRLALWLTADVQVVPTEKKAVAPEILPYMALIDVLINLHNHGDHMCLHLVKDQAKAVEEDLHLKLDSRTFLIAEQGEGD